MEAGKTYRRALLEKSQASARLAGALEVVSRLKGADHSGPGFMATAGFHYVVSNSEQVLGDSFYKVSSFASTRLNPLSFPLLLPSKLTDSLCFALFSTEL